MLTVEGYICLLHAKSSTRESPTGADRNGFRNPQRLILKEELRMKKVLSLVLAFAMILGSFGFVFASDFPDVKDTEYYSEPVNVLSGLGVIGGFPDGTFGPEKEVTRAQMATMIVNALGMTVTGQSDTKFTDVPKSHWASGFVNYATSVGFVAGFPDGTFKPDDKVTYDQALTMIVAALGYTSDALPGNWPGNFVNKAKGLGILDICATTGTAAAPRQDIACFLYKALTANIGYTDKDGFWHANVDNNGDPNDTMIARLGAVPYLKGDAFVVTGEESADINLQNYLGAYITAYASKDDDTKIIAIKEILSEFIEGTYKASKKQVVGDSTYKTDSAKYLGDDADDTDNYTSFTNGDVDGTAVDYATKDGASMKLAVKLNGTKISKVYSMQIWEADGYVQVEDKDMIEDILEDLEIDGKDFPTDEDDKLDTSAFACVGKDSINDIAEKDVITYYLHKSGDNNGKISKVEISDKTVEGTVTKINGDHDAFTIAGTAYGLSDGAPTLDYATLKGYMDNKTSGTYYLDYAGGLYEFEEAEGETSENFAVITSKCGVDTGRYGSLAFYLEGFLADGKDGEFQVKPTVDNGVGYYFNFDSDDNPTSWDCPDDYFKDVLVKYTLNSDDQIIDIEEPYSFGPSDEVKFDKNGIFDGKVLDKNAVVFSYDGEDYSVIKIADILEKDIDTMQCLLNDDNSAIVAVLVTGISEAENEYAFFVSKDAETAKAAVWTALYEGKVQEITVANDASPKPVEYVTGTAVAYTLTFNNDDAVKAADAVSFAYTEFFDTELALYKTSVSGNVFKIDTESYALADDVVVYVYDESDEKWTVGSKSSMAGRAGTLGSILMIDTSTGTSSDKEYDIVLVTKP
jgi:hypothetical protein